MLNPLAPSLLEALNLTIEFFSPEDSLFLNVRMPALRFVTLFFAHFRAVFMEAEFRFWKRSWKFLGDFAGVLVGTFGFCGRPPPLPVFAADLLGLLFLRPACLILAGDVRPEPVLPRPSLREEKADLALCLSEDSDADGDFDLLAIFEGLLNTVPADSLDPLNAPAFLFDLNIFGFMLDSYLENLLVVLLGNFEAGFF